MMMFIIIIVSIILAGTFARTKESLAAVVEFNDVCLHTEEAGGNVKCCQLNCVQEDYNDGCDCSFKKTGSNGAGKFIFDRFKGACRCTICPPGFGSNHELCAQVSPSPRHYVNSTSKDVVFVQDEDMCTYWGDDYFNQLKAYQDFRQFENRLEVVIDNLGPSVVRADDILSDFEIETQVTNGEFLFMRTAVASCGKLATPTFSMVVNNTSNVVRTTYGLKVHFVQKLENIGNLPITIEFSPNQSMKSIFRVFRATKPIEVFGKKLLPGTLLMNYPTNPPNTFLSSSEEFRIEIDTAGIPRSDIHNNQYQFNYSIVWNQYWKQGFNLENAQIQNVSVVLDFSSTAISIPNEIAVTLKIQSLPEKRRINLFNLQQGSDFNFKTRIEFHTQDQTWLSLPSNLSLINLESICPLLALNNSTQVSNEEEDHSKGFDLTFHPQELPPGVYYANIAIQDASLAQINVPVVLTITPGNFFPSTSTHSLTDEQLSKVRAGEIFIVEFIPRDQQGSKTSFASGIFSLKARYLSLCPFPNGKSCNVSEFTIGSSNFRLQIQLLVQGPYEFVMEYHSNSSSLGSGILLLDGIKNVNVLPKNCADEDPNSIPFEPLGSSCICAPSYGISNGRCQQCGVNHISVDSVCVPCGPEYRTRDSGALSCICRPEYFSDGSNCHPCPEGAFCADRTNSTLLPLQGYYKVPWSNLKFVKCREYSACIGIVIEDPSMLYNDAFLLNAVSEYKQRRKQAFDSSIKQTTEEDECKNQPICDSKYAGAICTNCAFGFTKIGRSECIECFNRYVMIFMIIVGVFVTLAFTIFTIRQSLKNEHTADEVQVLKILASHFQIIAMSTDFTVSYPTFLITMFEVFGALSSAGQALWSLECFVDVNAITPDRPCISGNFTSFVDTGMFDTNRLPAFFIESLAVALIPLFWLLGTGLFWTVRYFSYKRTGNPKMNSMFAYFIVSNIVVLFFLYPTLARTSFRFFSCSPERLPIGSSVQADSNILLLDADFNYICFGSSHLAWALSLGLFMILFYTIGIPFSSFFIIRKLRMVRTKYLHAFDFIWSGYRDNCYYWELIIMFRKILFAFTAVIIAPYGRELQVYIGIFILSLAVILQVHFRPYSNPRFNSAELFGILSALSTNYLGMYLDLSIVQTSNGNASTWISVLILLINVSFLAYCLRLIYVVSSVSEKKKVTRNASQASSSRYSASSPVRPKRRKLLVPPRFRLTGENVRQNLLNQ